MRVIPFLTDASLGLENRNAQTLKKGQFWKNGHVGLSHILTAGRRPSWELLDILRRYRSQLVLSKIWDKMFSTIHKSSFCCSWGDEGRQKESKGLQQACSRCCLRELPVSDHWTNFCFRVIILNMLQVGLTPIEADSHSYLLLRFSWASQAQQDSLPHSNYVSFANTLCPVISKYLKALLLKLKPSLTKSSNPLSLTKLKIL